MMEIGCQIGTIQGTIEEAAATLRPLGIQGLEVFSRHLEPYYGREREMKHLLAKLGIGISGAYLGHDGLVVAEEAQNAADRGFRAIDCLAEIGGGFLVVNGGVADKLRPNGFTEQDYERFGAMLNRLGKYGQSKGVGVAMHPHVGQMIVTCEDVERLLPHLDTALAGLCFHAAHQYMADSDAYAMYERHATHLKYLHIGDLGKDKKGELLGQGVLDQDRLMKPILNAGYDGWLIVECRKEGVAPADYVRNAQDYLKAKGWAG